MHARAGYGLTAFFLLLFCAPVALAQQNAYAQERPAFSQQQLDQMLAPIALYPDALLSQILMAATYPDDVVEAARWSRRNPGVAGDRAVRAVERMDWDPSVRSLVAFPQILDMLDEKIEWTADLGDAFLGQQAQVMDTVQYLRRKAHAAGNLQSNDQFRVENDTATFVISLANPELVYLPYYNSTVVYGTWWWPAYQPVYWAPWPGYHARPGYPRGYAWGPATRVERGFFFGAPDWHRRSVNVVNVNNYYYRPAHVHRQTNIPGHGSTAMGAANAWQHDAARRRDMPNREASSRQPAAAAVTAPAARHEIHARDPSGNNRGAPGNTPAPVVAAPPEVRGAPVNSSAPAPVVAAPSEVRSAPVHSSTPAPSARPVADQRPHATSAPDSVARGAEARGGVPRERPAAVIESRGETSQRPTARGDSGNHAAERRGTEPTAATVTARPAIASPPVVAIAPAVATPPAARSAPSQPIAQEAPGRGGRAEPRAHAAAAIGAPAAAERRSDRPHEKSRDHAGRQATESGDGKTVSASASSATSAAQPAGNSRGGGGNFRRPQ